MAVKLTEKDRKLIESRHPDPHAEKVLSVENLRISFKTDNGKVQAVRGVSFDLYRQETLCIVGESGSGKSVTSKAIMGILSPNAIVEDGHIFYQGEDLLRISEEEYHRIRGHKIGMIFQDPLSSLNPIVKIGKQITETMMINKNQLKNRYNDLISRELVAYKNAEVACNIAIQNAEHDYQNVCETLNQEKIASAGTLAEDKKAIRLAKKEGKDEKEAQEKYQKDFAEHQSLMATVREAKQSATQQKKAKIKAAKEEYRNKAPVLKRALHERKKTAKIENQQFHQQILAKRDADLAAISQKRQSLNLSPETMAKIKFYDDEIHRTKMKYSLLMTLHFFQSKRRAKLREKEDEEMIRLQDERRKYSAPLDQLEREEDAVRYHYQEQVKITRSMAKAHALEVMKEVGIPQPEKRYKQYPFQFSGGMRQRIVIAIALTAAPEILICDEPTTALDVTIQAQILELINRLKEERHLSCIFITHDLGVVANMADRVAVMYAGKICEYGTATEIFFDPRHPYTWALLSSIPDIDSKEKLEAIPGTPPDMIYPPIGDAFAARNQYALGIDLKYQPPFFKISDTHYAATWLEHEMAPEAEPPKIVVTRIKNALKDEEAKIEHEQKGTH